MGKITRDTYELKEEIITMLNREKHIVLATCSDGHVTARTISHANAGMDIFFQTDKRFLKVEQILKNPRVALCAGNLQIEGIAKLEGHPSDSTNADFCSLYKQKHLHSFEMYAVMKDEIVIKVKPSLFTIWKYIDGKPCRDYLNLNENIAYREYYELEVTYRQDYKGRNDRVQECSESFFEDKDDTWLAEAFRMPNVELTTMCMIRDLESNRVVVQDRVKSWNGINFPGGHVEDGESIIDAAIREVKEETGLDVSDLQPCGIIHWFNDQTGERYFVFNFKTDSWSGELLSETEEGKVFWVDIHELAKLSLVEGFGERLPMFLEDKYIEGFGTWNDKGISKMKFL